MSVFFLPWHPTQSGFNVSLCVISFLFCILSVHAETNRTVIHSVCMHSRLCVSVKCALITVFPHTACNRITHTQAKTQTPTETLWASITQEQSGHLWNFWKVKNRTENRQQAAEVVKKPEERKERTARTKKSAERSTHSATLGAMHLPQISLEKIVNESWRVTKYTICCIFCMNLYISVISH